MKQYDITGMSCAACCARVEKAVLAVGGVTDCAVSLLTNSMTVNGTASDGDIIRAVEKAGYGAAVREQSAYGEALKRDDPFTDHKTPEMKKRLLAGLAFLLVLTYVSMGRNMLSLPVPAFFDGNPAALGILQLLLAAAVMLINKRFFISGAKGILHGAPNMDTLVSLGSSASFLWSVYALFMMTDAQLNGASYVAEQWADSLYFDSAAMILVFISAGKLLEAKSRGKTTNALRSLVKLAPKTARIIRNGEEITVEADEITAGDIFTVRPGESIPADGVVIEGAASVNEAALTGESMPVDKSAGDGVCAATVDITGFLRCKAERVGEDTMLAQIIRIVSDAAASKAPVAKAADKAAGIFVPAVCGIAALTLIIWLAAGRAFDFALARAVSVLVISCPCALGLATPVAVIAGCGIGAKNGILFKNAAALENTGKTEIIVLDKTGTLTNGVPEVEKIAPARGVTEEELLKKAYSAELKSGHPLAGAVVREAKKRGMQPYETSDFSALPGRGVSAVINGKTVYGGSVDFISAKLNGDGELRDISAALAADGMTLMCFAEDGRPLGIIGAADTLKDDSASAVEELKNMGLRVVMLTGDNLAAAKKIGFAAGINSVIAGVLPNGKAEIIKRLKTLGRVAMAGDGINDAPALTLADVGIAIGAGTDVAIDAADIVLMNSRLSDAAAAIRLSRASLRGIRQNLFWAFFYNALCIPLAAGCFSSALGITLSPPLSAAAMSLSSFCVVMNALRLNLFDIRSVSRRKKRRESVDTGRLNALVDEINTFTEVDIMTKTLKIDGMMCPHCEAHVKKALEALEGVESAEADFKSGMAQVRLSEDVAPGALKAAVEDAGYAFIEVLP